LPPQWSREAYDIPTCEYALSQYAAPLSPAAAALAASPLLAGSSSSRDKVWFASTVVQRGVLAYAASPSSLLAAKACMHAMRSPTFPPAYRALPLASLRLRGCVGGGWALPPTVLPS
jgi:hypothetical protein